MKPLFFEFVDDQHLLLDSIINTQVLMGKNILAIPILEKGNSSREIYLPSGTKWYHMHKGTPYLAGNHTIGNVSIEDELPLLLKSGTCVFKQSIENIKNTKDLGSNFILYCGFDSIESKVNSRVHKYRAKG